MQKNLWIEDNLLNLDEASYENKKYKKDVKEQFDIDLTKSCTIHHLGNIKNDSTRVVFIEADKSTANFFHQFLHQISKRRLQIDTLQGKSVPPVYYRDVFGGFQPISFDKLVKFSSKHTPQEVDNLSPQQIFNELI